MTAYDADASDLVLCWPRPARTWVEAVPVGNGRLGAMVFGGIGNSRVQLNDSTVWSGTPFGPDEALADLVRRGAGPDRLDRIRSAIRSGDHRTAESLLMSFEGRYSQEFLPYVDLEISCAEGVASHYDGRTLNLDKGIVVERFAMDGTFIERRTWASAPDGVLCIEMTVDAGTVDVELAASSPLREVERVTGPSGIRLGIEIPVDGAPLHEPDVMQPLRYADGPVRGYDPYGAVSIAVATDGETRDRAGRLVVTGLTHLLVTIASATSAEHFWAAAGDWSSGQLSRETLSTVADRRARAALDVGGDVLLARHIADQVPLLSATRLRAAAMRGGRFDVGADLLGAADTSLMATVLFQWGRYLLVAASRANAGPPANLQGIWNADLRPAWSSNYTVNINTQMNYWPAETTGLPTTHLPLFDLLDRLSRTGRRVAASLYGCRGWVTHHNTDMWGWSLPVGSGHGDPAWAIWMMGGVWLTQHVWDHYDFGRDETFLKSQGWPILRDCAAFCLDWLVEGVESDGFLDTIPSTSPENHFRAADGAAEALSWSSTMDIALIRATFENTLAAAHVLGLDDPICAEISAALRRLRQPAITADGRLQEWVHDYVEHDRRHGTCRRWSLSTRWARSIR